MAIDTGIGISLTQVTTTKQAPLGQTVLDPAGSDGTGEQVYIYVGVTSAVTAVPPTSGQLVVRDAAQGYGNVEIGAAGVEPSRVVGAAQTTWATYASFTPTATELFGWVLRKGQGSAVDGGIVANQGAIPDAAGAVQASGGVTAANIGVCTLIAGAVATCVLDCKG